MKILKFIAKGYISRCTKNKVEIDLLFFVHWEGCDSMHIKDKFQSIANLPKRETVLTIVNFRQLEVRHLFSSQLFYEIKLIINFIIIFSGLCFW